MPKGVALPLDPEGAIAEDLAHRAALGDAGLADEDEQVEVALCKGEQVLVEPGVGGQDQGAVRAAGAVFLAALHAFAPLVWSTVAPHPGSRKNF